MHQFSIVNFVKHGLCAVIATTVMLPGVAAWAQQGTCYSGTPWSNVRPVRVNFQSFSGATNLTLEEVRVAALHAVAQWSESSAGAALEFAGDTTCTTLAPGNCCTSNLLIYEPNCSAGSARTRTAPPPPPPP